MGKCLHVWDTRARGQQGLFEKRALGSCDANTEAPCTRKIGRGHSKKRLPASMGLADGGGCDRARHEQGSRRDYDI